MSTGDGGVAELRARLERLIEDAARAGALDSLRRAFEELCALQEQGPHELPEPASVPGRFGLVGDSEPIGRVYSLIERAAPADVPVLVLGETGTGKELVAAAIHHASRRASKPFFAVNCAAVPAQLLESELFGHKRGSFTGAVADRVGHFAAADGGTVFLDEIGDMPLEMQAKLLRVLQEGEVRPVGSNKIQHVDVRIVAATHRDLARMCAERAFRDDLYFRLEVVTLRLPPLRERRSDIPHLVRHLLGRIERELGRRIEVTSEALEILTRWRWPGNVRELENELRRAAVFSDGSIGAEALSPRLATRT